MIISGLFHDLPESLIVPRIISSSPWIVQDYLMNLLFSSTILILIISQDSPWLLILMNLSFSWFYHSYHSHDSPRTVQKILHDLPLLKSSGTSLISSSHSLISSSHLLTHLLTHLSSHLHTDISFPWTSEFFSFFNLNHSLRILLILRSSSSIISESPIIFSSHPLTIILQ